MKKNIGIVGCGHWGKNLIRNFHSLGSLHCISDKDSSTAESFSKQYNVLPLTFEEMINSKDVEGIVIAAPAVLHANLAIKALEAGKHVFVEKPLATNLEDAQRIIKASEISGNHLMVGHLLQYHPIFIHLKEMVKKGRLGNINYIHSNRLSLGKIRTDENVIWSFAPHDISMILSLIDACPDQLLSVGNKILGREIIDRAMIHIKFKNKVEAHIHVSWAEPFKQQSLVINGSEGMIVFDDTKPWEEKLIYYKHKFDFNSYSPTILSSDPELIEVRESEPLKDECRYFIGLIQGSLDPRTDGHEGLKVLEILSATDRSLASGTYEKIK